jgi:hypothetical protein
MTQHEQQIFLEVEYAEAKECANWLAIMYDLCFVIDATERLCGLLTSDSQDNVIIKSLWSAALVSYVRCFTSGKRRTKLDAAIFSDLPGDPLGTHQCYKDTRDKHVAHPVNSFEEIKIGILVDDGNPDGQWFIAGMGHMRLDRMCDSMEGVEQLRRLAIFALHCVESEVGRWREATLEKARALKRSELVRLKSVRMKPQGGADAARKPR